MKVFGLIITLRRRVAPPLLSSAVLPDIAQLRENGASGTPSRAF